MENRLFFEFLINFFILIGVGLTRDAAALEFNVEYTNQEITFYTDVVLVKRRDGSRSWVDTHQVKTTPREARSYFQFNQNIDLNHVEQITLGLNSNTQPSQCFRAEIFPDSNGNFDFNYYVEPIPAVCSEKTWQIPIHKFNRARGNSNKIYSGAFPTGANAVGHTQMKQAAIGGLMARLGTRISRDLLCDYACFDPRRSAYGCVAVGFVNRQNSKYQFGIYGDSEISQTMGAPYSKFKMSLGSGQDETITIDCNCDLKLVY